MVTIGLPSPLVSILVSIISCIIELLFLKSLRNAISLWEHSLLQNDRPLPLKAHVRRVSIAQSVPLICFIVLEIVFSLHSSSTVIKTRKQEACTSLRLSVDTNFSDAVFTDDAAHVFASCLRVSGDVASVHLGNLSSVSNKVECSESAVYRFKFEDEQELETDGGTLNCVSVGGAARCAWVKKEGSTLWMSETSDGLSLFDEKAFFSRTELLFDVDDRFLPLFSRRIARVEHRGSYFFRKKVLLDSIEDVCHFVDEQKAGTIVPDAVAVLLLVIWSISLSGFFMSCVVRGRRLYDVANAFEMVTRTVRVDNDQVYPIQNAAVFRRQGSSRDAGFVMRRIDEEDSP